MTDRSTQSNPGWIISTRCDGEVLTAGAANRGLHLHLLGVPPGFAVAEIEGWLRDLVGVAHETSREDAEGGAIPSLLHHALTGLLFSHSQLWNHAGGPTPCSFACAVAGGQVAFGWVGEASIQVRVDDEPIEITWVRVRDDDGRSAQAGSFDAESAVRIRLYWSSQPGSPDAPGATMVAEWPGAAAAAEAAAPAVAAEEAPVWQPPAWMPDPGPTHETGPPRLQPDDAAPLMDVLQELDAVPPTRESGPPPLFVDEVEARAHFDTSVEALAPGLDEHQDQLEPVDEETLDPLAWKPPAIALGVPRADLRSPDERSERRGPPTQARPVVEERRGVPTGGRKPPVDEPLVAGANPFELEEGNASFLDPGATMTPRTPRSGATSHLSKPSADRPQVLRSAAPMPDAAPVAEPARAPWKPILPPSPSAPWRDTGDDEAIADAPGEQYADPAAPIEMTDMTPADDGMEPAALSFEEVEPVPMYQESPAYEPAPSMESYGDGPMEPRVRGFMAWISSLVPWKRKARPTQTEALTFDDPVYPSQGVVPDTFGRGANEGVRSAPAPTAAAEGFDLDRLFDEPGDAPAPIAHDVPGVPDLIPPPEVDAEGHRVAPPPGLPPAIEARMQRAEAKRTAAAPPRVETPKAAPRSAAPVMPSIATAPARPAAPAARAVPAPPPAPVVPEPADEFVVPDEFPADVPPADLSPAVLSEEDLLAQTVEFLEPAFEPRAPRAAGLADAGAPAHPSPPKRRKPRPFAPEPGPVGHAIDLEFTQTPPVWKRPWLWVALVTALFVGGFVIGLLQSPENGGFGGALRSLGLGGARFQLEVTSRPPGAWIAVDGKELTRRTPATIDLTPGEHEVTLSFIDHGSAAYTVRGENGDKEQLDAPMWGGLAIYSADQAMPVSVSVDGESRGFAPLTVDSLMPGTHEVRFSGPGTPSWGQTIEVRVRETAEVVARSMTSPATGLLEIRARANGAGGGDDLDGAQVWVDGALRGRTPLSLELPRGPHSIRVAYQAETAPIQLIDLPGGNQRFATFEFGLGLERPAFAPVALPARIPLEQPTVVSAVLRGLEPGELREMWLHVRNGDGTWRRTAMTMLKASDGVVGVGVFPLTSFDAKGHTSWYASAVTTVGDEYYTEISGIDSAAR